MSRLTRRQAAGVALAAALVAVAVVAGLLDQPGVALAALALTTGLLFAALLQVRRRVADLAGRTDQLGTQARSWSQRATGGEQHQQQLRAELARERRAAADRQQALLRAVERDQKATGAAIKQLGKQLVWQQRQQTREVEALLQLFREFEPRAPMPSSGHWALNPTDLLELWSVVDRWRPELVLELGSGTSSVWLGYAVERYRGRLVSVDHDPAYAEQARAQLRRHGLERIAEVRDAPLRELTVGEETFQWYDPAAMNGLAGVDLLAVDGPPGGTGPQARYPALPLLAEKLSARAVVLLDDADRPDEEEILRRWTGSVPGLSREPAMVGHLAVLSYARP